MEEGSSPLEYQIFTLAFTEPGAVTFFDEHLPSEVVGTPSGNTGIHQLYLSLIDFHRRTHLDPVDPIAFRSWLENETEIVEALGGSTLVVDALIEHIQSITPTTKESIAALLKHRANKRRQLDALQDLHLLVNKKEHKTEEDNNRIRYLTDQIRALEQEIDYDPFEQVLTGTDIAHHTDDLWELPDFLSTQYKSLNRAIGYTENGGYVRGSVNSIIAPSGKGKSTFAKCLMNHWVEEGHTVLYVNYEEPVAHWERILLTQITGTNVYKGDEIPFEERMKSSRKFVEKMEEWGGRFMVRHDPDTSYFEDLEQWLRDLVGHNTVLPEVIIIDTIQSMFLKNRSGKPRWGEYEQMMVQLEKLAKDTNSIIIITSQENSNRMKERREVVELSDVGGSLTIAQKSTICLFITPVNAEIGKDSESDYLMQLQIPKNRITGATFTKKPPLVLYRDETKRYEEWDENEHVQNYATTDLFENFDLDYP